MSTDHGVAGPVSPDLSEDPAGPSDAGSRSPQVVLAALSVHAADLTIGTSAAATAAAQMAGATPAELSAVILAAAPRNGPVQSDPRPRTRSDQAVAAHLERIGKIIALVEQITELWR